MKTEENASVTMNVIVLKDSKGGHVKNESPKLPVEKLPVVILLVGFYVFVIFIIAIFTNHLSHLYLEGDVRNQNSQIP